MSPSGPALRVQSQRLRQEEVVQARKRSLAHWDIRHHKGFHVTPWWLPPESAYKSGSQPLPLSPVLY